MNHRMSDANRGTRARHHEAQMKLLRMIVELRITVEAGEAIGQVQRDAVLSTIQETHNGIQMCYSDLDDILKGDVREDFIKYVAPPQMMNHIELTRWLSDMSMDLKRQGDPALFTWQGRPITVERLDAGEHLVDGLGNCRERVVYFR